MLIINGIALLDFDIEECFKNVKKHENYGFYIQPRGKSQTTTNKPNKR